MITKFKIYENHFDLDFKIFESFWDQIKPGDIVVCTDPNKTLKIDGIKYGNKYRVVDIQDYLITLAYYKKNIIIKDYHTHKVKKFFIKYFVPELEWEAKKYNL
jgi:hypothetical protein